MLYHLPNILIIGPTPKTTVVPSVLAKPTVTSHLTEKLVLVSDVTNVVQYLDKDICSHRHST